MKSEKKGLRQRLSDIQLPQYARAWHVVALLLYIVGAALSMAWVIAELDPGADCNGEGCARLVIYHGFKDHQGRFVQFAHDYPVVWLLVVPFVTGFIFHLYAAVDYHGHYVNHIKARVNPARWIESMVGDGAILWNISSMYGLAEFWNSLNGIFVMHALACYLGYDREHAAAAEAEEDIINSKAESVPLKTFFRARTRAATMNVIDRTNRKWRTFISVFAFTVLWTNLWWHFAQFLKHMDNAPVNDWTVYYIMIGTFLTHVVHQVLHLMYLWGSDWINLYIHVEHAYIATNILYRFGVLPVALSLAQHRIVR